MTYTLVVGLVLLATTVFYVGASLWLLFKGWPLRAGLAMAAVSLLPLLVPDLPDSEAPGSGLPTAMMLLGALLMIATGLFMAAVRYVSRLLKARRRGRLQSI